MAMYRPGAATALVEGAIAAAGTTFNVLARSVLTSPTTKVRDVTSDGDQKTVLATNGLIGGVMRVVGWSDSASAILIEALGEAASEAITCTVMPFATTGKKMTVEGTPEGVRVAYEKTDVGVALAFNVRISNIVHA